MDRAAIRTWAPHRFHCFSRPSPRVTPPAAHKRRTLSKSALASIGADRGPGRLAARARGRVAQAIAGDLRDRADTLGPLGDEHECVRVIAAVRGTSVPRCGFTGAGRRGLHQRESTKSPRGSTRLGTSFTMTASDTMREIAPRRDAPAPRLCLACADDGTDDEWPSGSSWVPRSWTRRERP